MEQSPTMRPVFGTEICSMQELKKTEMYNDFLRKYHPYHLYFGLVTVQSQRAREVFSLLHRVDKGPPEGETIERLKLVLPHLKSALELRRKLVEVECARDDRGAALDALRTAILLVDERGHCFFANRAAERMLGEQDGLLLRGGKLSAQVTEESSRLEALVRNATNVARGRDTKSGSAMLISRKLRKALEVRVSTFLPGDLGVAKRTVAAVLISDPEEQASAPGEMLRALYGFTPAEIRLATAFGEGKELREICEQGSIAYATGRAHLRSIFAKTGVRRQTELMALLVRASQVFGDETN